jgi:hypothetical protein
MLTTHSLLLAASTDVVDNACNKLNQSLLGSSYEASLATFVQLLNQATSQANLRFWAGKKPDMWFIPGANSRLPCTHPAVSCWGWHSCWTNLTWLNGWPLCGQGAEAGTVPWPIARRQRYRQTNDTCLVYSIGIANQWSFDDRLGDMGCEVHSFDPTKNTLKAHYAHAHKGVHFHPWAIGSTLPCHHNSAERVKSVYGELLGDFRSLSEIRRSLGHEHRRISLLKIDCEGCEWDALFEAAHESRPFLDYVDALYLELHPNQAMQMRTEADMIKMAVVWEHIFREQGFQIWFWHNNHGKAAAHRQLPKQMAQMPGAKAECCFELALVRERRTAHTLQTFGTSS